MATIITRAGKGAPLTWAEADANFTNLNTDKLEASALSSYLTSSTAASTYETQTHATTTYTATTDLAADTGSSLVGFIQTGTNAVARTGLDKLRESVSVKDFGAVGDGIADDTVKIQAAITAMQGTGAQVFFPRGTYKISSSLNITGTISLVGESRAGVSIIWTSTTLDAVVVSCDTEVNFEKITFSGPLLATSGACVSLSGATTHNLFSSFEDCSFVQGFTHILTSTAADWSVGNCMFSEYANHGIYVADTYSPDAGDSIIDGCTFATTSTAANSAAIFQINSGGLKVIGNKIVGGSSGYRLQLASTGISTIDLVISGNSIENQINYGIYLERPSGSNVFGNVVISGNQLSNMPNPIHTDAVAGWLSRVAITGNQITLSVGNGTCITVGAASGFLIDGNQLTGQTGTTYGISIGSGATIGIIGVNSYSNLTTRIDNGAPTKVFNTNSANQNGTATVTCSTVSGSIYLGTVAVTYPTGFDFAPVVTCSPNTVTGAISAWPLNITKTGFTLVCLSVLNGGTGSAAWNAQGVI